MSLYEETVAAIGNFKGGIPVKSLSKRQIFGEHDSPKIGQGVDFYQIRGYDPERGDNVGSIVWSHSAKPGGVPMVRDYVRTKDFPVMLLADLSSSIDFGEKISRKRELLPKRKLLLECAGILGLTASRVQDRVGLIGFTDEAVVQEPAKGGSENIYHLILRLCEFLENVPARERRRTDLFGALETLGREAAGTALVIVLSDFIGLENVDEQLLLRRIDPRKEYIFLILHDPKEFQAQSRFGYVLMENRETGEKISVPARKLPAILREIEAGQSIFRDKLGKIGIDSAVLTYGEHFKQLSRFFIQRKEGP